MFTLSVHQGLSNFLRSKPLKNHCRRRGIEGELEKASGLPGTFRGLCNTQTQNDRICEELRNYSPSPPSSTACGVSQVRVDTIYPR